MMRKGRNCFGEKRPEAKLTEIQVRKIFNEGKVHYRGYLMRISERYGVAPATIRDILFGKTWKHLLLGESK